MNSCIIEIYPNKKVNKNNIIDAHLRNSIILSNYLNCDLLLNEIDFKKALNKKYDVLILGYASFYAPFKYIRKLIENNKNAKKIIISNEYNIGSSVGGFRPYELISNYENVKLNKTIIKHHFLNLNLLYAREANDLNKKKYDCIYYGTFRENRKKYFKEYLCKNIYLSTSIKNMKKFNSIRCNPKYIKKLDWIYTKETLNLFRYSLYIEDEYTHNVYNCLANRWYEAGFCNNIVFFDKNCANTIYKSEIKNNFDEFFLVNDYDDLIQKINICNKDFNKYLNIQKAMRENELFLRKKMLIKFKKIVEDS